MSTATRSLSPIPTAIRNSTDSLTIQKRIQQLLNKQDPNDGCNGANWFSLANTFGLDYDSLITQILSLDVECKPNRQLFERRRDFESQFDRIIANVGRVPGQGCTAGSVMNVTYGLWYQRLSRGNESRLSRSDDYIQYLTRINAFSPTRVNSTIQSDCITVGEANVDEVGILISAFSLNAATLATSESLTRQFLNSSSRNVIDDSMGIISPALGSVYSTTQNVELKDVIARYFSLRTKSLQEKTSFGQLSLLHSSLFYGILNENSLAEFGSRVEFDPFASAADLHSGPTTSGWVAIGLGIFVALTIFLFTFGRWLCRPMTTPVVEIDLEEKNTIGLDEFKGDSKRNGLKDQLIEQPQVNENDHHSISDSIIVEVVSVYTDNDSII